MDLMRISKPDRSLRGAITLDGSKSLSNRALIILALCGADPADWLSHLSSAKDTNTLLDLLRHPADIYDAGDAGTTFRFLTAFLALQPGAQVLTGSVRMRQRPVGALVDALRSLGAEIQYLENPGYPPLRIGGPAQIGRQGNTVRIDAGVSSQFLSALLLIGPYLPEGLRLLPEGRLVSRPYLDMTLRMMQYFGAEAIWEGQAIRVRPGRYTPHPLRIEADWSAASYWYALAALAGEAELALHGLFPDSWQGDAVLMHMMEHFGVGTIATEAGIMLHKNGTKAIPPFQWNFLECPDIAQTLAVLCAGLGTPGHFTGLETLAIKETDRTAALTTELAKVGVTFDRAEASAGGGYRLEGKAAWNATPRFATYGDHRMAMAFATLALLHPVEIEHPGVVAKSYPGFWEHLHTMGFTVQKTEAL